ncbi:MAG TPA: molecular chaperone TorD family protein [Phycisphaerae bacterium]|nr:molecular chaperone TorD family protein [Phycisphaerae bacterium]
MSETNGAISVARSRAVVYAGLANGFRYPDADQAALVCNNRHCGEWAAALACVIGAEAIDPFTAYRRGSRSTVCGHWTLEKLESAHNELFGHAVRGRCPAYECEYGRSEISQRASMLADLAGFYEAFGMTIVDTEAGRPDFIAVECEFMSVLCAKEAHGLESGLTELVEESLHTQRLFLRDHLATWLPALSRRIVEAADHEFYVALGQCADQFCRAEARRFEIRTGPRWLELRPTDPESETSINCFDADDCGAQTGEQLVPLNVNLHQQ